MDMKAFLDFLVPFVGIGGFNFGRYQYRQAQTWKRLEFTAQQLQRLYTEPDLHLAGTFFNYSKRGVPLPETLWEYAGTKVFDHHCREMYRLMSSRYVDEVAFFIYNDTIDRLFEYLDQIYMFLDMRLIQIQDIESLRWILDDIE